MSKPKVLVVQPNLQPPGGGNGVCAWMLQALRDDYALTLLTWEPVDLDEVNRYFGTSLGPTDFSIQVAAPRARRIVNRIGLPLATFKSSVLRRRCKQIGHDFDLVMTASNEADFGRRGIQYIHYPVRHAAPLPVDLRWYHWPWALAVYEGCWSLVARFDDDLMRGNLTLVNSEWTGRLVSSIHDIPVHVVHPPAAGTFEDIPWDDREDGFLCIGRLSPEKRIETAIEIVRRVRQDHPSAHLHVIGSDDNPAYAGRLREGVRRAGSWVTLEGTLRLDTLQQMLSSHRFAIHAMREEHFGMAIAQTLRAGCIPFVPDGGGQVEIVGDEPLLRYRSVEDAVEKISAVLTDAALRDEIRARLASRAVFFTPARFMAHIRSAVVDALSSATLPIERSSINRRTTRAYAAAERPSEPSPK